MSGSAVYFLNKNFMQIVFSPEIALAFPMEAVYNAPNMARAGRYYIHFLMDRTPFGGAGDVFPVGIFD